LARPDLTPWDFSAPDWADRLRAGKPPAQLTGHPLNRKRSAKAVAIWNRLKLPDVAGQPPLSEAGGEWFRQVVRLAAGGLDSNGEQHLRDILISVPKKSSKTTYSAALVLALMMLSPRPRGEFILIAPTHEIAQIAYRQASGMIYADAHLSERFHVREHLKSIVDRESGCTMRVVTFSMDTATGSKASLALLDEAHLLTHENAPRVIGQIRGAQAAIAEGQLITISTQADTEARGYWRAELGKARKVRDGELRLAGYLPLIYEMPPAMVQSGEWKDPANWKLVNPNLGRSVDLAWLKRSYQEAEAAGSGELARWASQHLNLENTGEAIAADDRWAGAYLWPDAHDPQIATLDDILDYCDVVAVGVDGGGLDDLMALSVLGRDRTDWLTWTRAWCTPAALERRQSISGTLRDFEADGDLRIVSPGADVLELAELVAQIHRRGKLLSVGIDPAGVGVEVGEALEAHGVPKELIVAVGQGYRLMPAYTTLERRLDRQQLAHAGQPLMRWAVRNAKRSERGLITKAASGTGKIDPLVALANAAMVMNESPPMFDVEAMIS
jgi:phage terminase large subunit-like protein